MTSREPGRGNAGERPGRTCPLAYRYAPAALARESELNADTLYVIGWLYGNPFALAAMLELAQNERGPADAPRRESGQFARRWLRLLLWPHYRWTRIRLRCRRPGAVML